MSCRFLFYFFLIVGANLVAQEESLLTIVIMVKDEESVIEKTLQPYLDAGIKDYLLYDTGSTDLTVSEAEQLFNSYKDINYKIIQEPFIDFSTSRNNALEHADNCFNSIFYLMPDAEWYFENTLQLLEFCTEKKGSAESSYMMHIKGDAFSFYIPRLIRAKTKSRFINPVHEQLSPFCDVKAPSSCYFKWKPVESGINKTRKRLETDIHILLEKYDNNPQDPHTLFFLAKTYECLQDYKNAYRFYGERSRISTTNIEADFITLYRLGSVSEAMSQENELTWPVALYYYLRAYGLYPQRAEPLIKIAQYYLAEDNIPSAYLFIKQACQIPYPHNDIIMVEDELYLTLRYELLAICAWCMNNEQEAHNALEFALLTNPKYQSTHEYLQALIGEN